MLQYFKSFINRNLLNRGGAITDPISSSPPPPPTPPPTQPPTQAPPTQEDDDELEPTIPTPTPTPPVINPLVTPINIRNSYLSNTVPLLASAGMVGAGLYSVYNNFRNTQQPRISQAGALHQHTNVNREQVRQNLGASEVVAREFNRRPSINEEPETNFRESPLRIPTDLQNYDNIQNYFTDLTNSEPVAPQQENIDLTEPLVMEQQIRDPELDD